MGVVIQVVHHVKHVFLVQCSKDDCHWNSSSVTVGTVHGLSVMLKGAPKPSYHPKNRCQVKNFNNDDLKGNLFLKQYF
ncbi:TPA: hypothetical protein ACIBS5_004360, partial [Salmonella enterica subsp. diarizonae serovar 60-67:z35:-]